MTFSLPGFNKNTGRLSADACSAFLTALILYNRIIPRIPAIRIRRIVDSFFLKIALQRAAAEIRMTVIGKCGRLNFRLRPRVTRLKTTIKISVDRTIPLIHGFRTFNGIT